MSDLIEQHIKSVSETGIPILNRKMGGDGRWMIYAPEGYQGTVYKSGLIYEHRIIMEYYIKKNLTFNEIVHHKDGNKLNNKLENLELMSRAEHTSHHDPEPEVVSIKCDFCGVLFQRNKNQTYKKYEHNFCSLSHSVKFQMREMHRTATIKHGTQSGYRHGCRCDLCKGYQNDRMRIYRKTKNKIKQGVV